MTVNTVIVFFLDECDAARRDCSAVSHKMSFCWLSLLLADHSSGLVEQSV